MKVLITGGCGFIGVNLVKYLLERDKFKIIVYDNLSTGSRDSLDRAVNIKDHKDHLDIVEGDVLDPEKIESAARGCDSIVHLAAHTRVVESLEIPRTNFEVNSIGTFNVLEAARKNNVKRFIFASSNAAVGEQEPPIHEEMIPRPISPYGASKLHGEALCSAYFHSYGISTIALRFSNVYGPYSAHKTSVIAKFIKRIKDGKPLEIFGDGKQTRDFIHVGDICRVIYKCLTFGNGSGKGISGKIFQVGTGMEMKIIDLTLMLREIAGEEGIEVPDIIHKEELKGEIRRNFTDITRLSKALGFEPSLLNKKKVKELF